MGGQTKQTIFKTAPDGDLMIVNWAPGSFPYDPLVAGEYFPNRDLVISTDEERWYGVTCTPAEWEEFIGVARDALNDDPNPVGTTRALALVERLEAAYLEYQTDTPIGPWRTPWTTGRLAAMPRRSGPPFIPPPDGWK